MNQSHPVEIKSRHVLLQQKFMHYRITAPVSWYKDITMQPCTIQVGEAHNLETKHPLPSGEEVGRRDVAKRILSSFKASDRFWCVVQAGQGEDVAFALVAKENVVLE